jgi:hypothetical protein
MTKLKLVDGEMKLDVVLTGSGENCLSRENGQLHLRFDPEIIEVVKSFMDEYKVVFTMTGIVIDEFLGTPVLKGMDESSVSRFIPFHQIKYAELFDCRLPQQCRVFI